MFDSSTRVAALGLLLGTARAQGAAEFQADQLSAIETHPSGSGGTVVLRGNHPPVFSVFRLNAPDRIVVDLAGADVSKAHAPARSDIPGVGEISAVQFQKGDTKVGRIVLVAEAGLAYEAKVVGDDVVVTLSRGAGAPALPGPQVDEAIEAVPQSAQSAAAPGASQAAQVNAPPNDAHLLERFVDHARPGQRTGHRSFRQRGGRGTAQLTIQTDGPAGEVTVLRLRDPNRVAVDLTGFQDRGARARTAGSVQARRFGKVAGAARVVFDPAD